MKSEIPSLVNLTQELTLLSQQRATGELILSADDNQWHIYLFFGRLLYATGKTHRFRRWRRVLKQSCPDIKPPVYFGNEPEPWEYHLLNQGIQQKHLSITQAKNIISSSIHEILFTLVSRSDLSRGWVPRKIHPIALLDIEQFLHASQELWQEWQNLGLAQLRPEQAPVLKQHRFESNLGFSETVLSLIPLINGSYTIWDIACQVGRSVTDVGKVLQQLAIQGILELQTVPDLLVLKEAGEDIGKRKKESSKLSLNTSNANELEKQIYTCSQERFTGRLDIEGHQGQQWSLYFRIGYLVGCKTLVHPMRRWYRQLSQHCPELLVDIVPHLDYNFLAELNKEKKVSRKQIEAIIKGLITEILFDVCQNLELKLTYNLVSKNTLDITDSILVFLPTNHVWQEAMEAWEAWQKAGLANYSPNLAPIIWHAEELQRQASPGVYHNLTHIINGNQTLRDLAVKLKQNLLPLTESIIPYIQQKLLGLVEVEDLTNISQLGTPAASLPSPTKVVEQQAPSSLVAYIDDSQSDSLKMSHILNQAHYRFISIQDPVKALPMLLEHKPDLIFLDLVMPIANGYEICAQIRRISAFKETPIIILTSNDGIVDRVRAKMVGSSGFLPKPITSEKVQKVLQKYLSSTMSLMEMDNREQTKVVGNPIDNFEF